MSIKFFHLFFIVVCTLFSFGVGGWCVVTRGDTTILVTGIIFLLLGAGLAVYAVYFFKKWRKEGFFL